MDNEETKQVQEEVTEATEATEEAVSDSDGFDALDDNMKLLIERRGTKLPAPEAVEDAVEEEQVEESEPLFVLEDGTKVMTADEAKKGYMLQRDYTKKRQEAVALEKDLQQYGALIDKMKEDPKLTRMVIDYITNNGQPPQTQSQQQGTETKKIEVPDDYKNDPFVTRLAELTNSLSDEVSQLKTGFNTIHQEKTAVQQRTELDTKINTRIAEAYNELKGQVETPPTPQEFMERIAAHFNELGLTPDEAAALITGPDPVYLSAKVERIFAADISKVRSAKTTVAEKERKKRVATTTALRAGGKSSTIAPQSLPKGKDGKLDIKAALIQIQDAQEQSRRG